MQTVNLRDVFCKHFKSDIYQNIKNRTWGEKSINIASLISIEQLNRFCDWVSLIPGHNILDACCGVGETTKYFSERMQCNGYGIDVSSDAINAAKKLIVNNNMQLKFKQVDIKNNTYFEDGHFDAIACIEAILYFSYNDRLSILKEWNRLLKPKGKLIFTDPCVITGIMSTHEIATRASFGEYYFSTLDAQIRLFNNTGFELIKVENITDSNAALLSRRWQKSREYFKDELQQLETNEEYECIEKFIYMCNKIYSGSEAHRKLSQFAYYLIKR